MYTQGEDIMRMHFIQEDNTGGNETEEQERAFFFHDKSLIPLLKQLTIYKCGRPPIEESSMSKFIDLSSMTTVEPDREEGIFLYAVKSRLSEKQEYYKTWE